jgi:hypothetical protein
MLITNEIYIVYFGFLVILAFLIYKLLRKKEKKPIIKILIIPIIILWFLISPIGLIAIYEFRGFYYFTTNKKTIEKAIKKNEQIKITSDSLILQFSENIKMADELYENKIIQISGVVSKILMHGDELSFFNDRIEFLFTDPNGYINCFTSYNDELVSGLKFTKELKDRNITIIGKYRSSYYMENNKVMIIMYHCGILNINE